MYLSRCRGAPNLPAKIIPAKIIPAKIIPAKINWLNISGGIPCGHENSNPQNWDYARVKTLRKPEF